MIFKNNSFYTLTQKYFILVSACIALICIFFIPFFSDNDTNKPLSNSSIESTPQQEVYQKLNYSDMYWPLPGYTRISSPFGYRSAPTAGATSFHGGIDIPAPEGTNIVSAISGKVTRTGFMGSGGCSVVVKNEKYTVIFHHVSPNYLVKTGDSVTCGQIIARVGPKNVYGFPQNPYKDSRRRTY